MNLDRRDESVAASDDGLKETRIVRAILERHSDFPYGRIETRVQVLKGPRSPKSYRDFLPGYRFSSAFEQQNHEVEGNLLQRDRAPRPHQLKTWRTQTEIAEFVFMMGHRSTRTGSISPQYYKCGEVQTIFRSSQWNVH